jgi:uncharacterized protein (DUF433 family)
VPGRPLQRGRVHELIRLANDCLPIPVWYLGPVARVIDIYRGKDPRMLPRYGVAEAAHYLRLPPATLKTWVHGRIDANGHQAAPVIVLPRGQTLLSFQNLVEAHVLSAIRREHGVSLQRVRKALNFVRRKLHQANPLVTAKFQTDGVDLFVEEIGKLINASRDGQTAMAEALRTSLERVEHASDGLAVRLYPFIRGGGGDTRNILVDPVSFGRPVVARSGVPVSVVVGRFRAGESVESIAEDYRIPVEQAHDAIRSAIPAAA